MSTESELAAARIELWADSLEPALRKAVLKAWADVRKSAPLAELVRRIEGGDVDGALRLLFDSPEAKASLARLRGAYAQGLQDVAAKATRALNTSPAVRVVVQAPVADAGIIDAVRRWEDSAFRNLVTEAREGLRSQVATELQRGIGPRQVASAIKGDVGRVGLTAYDEQILANARADLEAGRLNEFLGRKLRDKRYDGTLAKGKALTPKQIESMLAAYRKKLVAFRASTFARTSAIQAANDASQASYEKAVADGAIKLEELRRYWIVSRDEKLCEVCQPIPGLNAEGRMLREPFVLADGSSLLTPTAHPACRCTVFMRVQRAGVRQRPAPGTTRFVFA